MTRKGDISQKASNQPLGFWVNTQMSGHRDAEEEGAVDAKTEMGKDKRFFPTLP